MADTKTEETPKDVESGKDAKAPAKDVKKEKEPILPKVLAIFESQSSHVVTDFHKSRSRVLNILNLFLIALMVIFQAVQAASLPEFNNLGNNWLAAIATLLLLLFSLIVNWTSEYTDFSGFLTASAIGLVPVFWQLLVNSLENTAVLVWFVLPVVIQHIVIFSWKWSVFSIFINYGLFWVAFGTSPMQLRSVDDIVAQVTLMSFYGLLGCLIAHKDIGVLHDHPRRTINQFIYQIDTRFEEFRAVYAGLLYPSPEVTATSDRIRAKIAAAITLVATLMGIVWLATLAATGWEDVKGVLLSISLVVYLLGYILSRTKFFRWGVGLFVTQPCWYYIFSLALQPRETLVTQHQEFAVLGPVYMVISLFVAALFFKLWIYVALMLVFFLVSIFLPLAVPELIPNFAHTTGVFIAVALCSLEYARRMRTDAYKGQVEDKKVELVDVVWEEEEADKEILPEASLGAKIADLWRYTSPLLDERESGRAIFTSLLDFGLLIMMLLFQAIYGTNLNGMNWVAFVGTFCLLIFSYFVAKTTQYINFAGFLTVLSVSVVPVFWQYFTLATLEGMYVLVWFLVPVVIGHMAIHHWIWQALALAVNYALFWCAFALSIQGELDDITVQITMMSVIGIAALLLKRKDAAYPYDQYKPRRSVPEYVAAGSISTVEFRWIWTSLFYPAVGVIGSKDRWRAKTATFFLFVAVIINAIWLGLHVQAGWEDAMGGILIAALVLSVVAYGLSRTTAWRWGVGLYVLQSAWYYVLRLGLTNTSPFYAVIGPGYMAVSIYFGSLFIKMAPMLPLKVILLACSFAAPDAVLYRPNIGYELAYVDIAHSVGVVFFVSVLSLDFGTMKREWELSKKERKAAKQDQKPADGTTVVDMATVRAAQAAQSITTTTDKDKGKGKEKEDAAAAKKAEAQAKKEKKAAEAEAKAEAKKKKKEEDEKKKAAAAEAKKKKEAAEAEAPKTPKAKPITQAGDKPEAVTPVVPKKADAEPEADAVVEGSSDAAAGKDNKGKEAEAEAESEAKKEGAGKKLLTRVKSFGKKDTALTPEEVEEAKKKKEEDEKNKAAAADEKKKKKEEDAKKKAAEAEAKAEAKKKKKEEDEKKKAAAAEAKKQKKEEDEKKKAAEAEEKKKQKEEEAKKKAAAAEAKKEKDVEKAAKPEGDSVEGKEKAEGK